MTTPDPSTARVELLGATLRTCPEAEGLSDPQRAAILCVLVAPTAWSMVARPRAEAAQALGRELRRYGVKRPDREAWLDGLVAAGHERSTLAELADRGWLAAWESPVGPAVTLSALAATWLGVTLVEFGCEDNPESRWDKPVPRPIKLRRAYGNPELLRLMAAPGPSPEEEAIMAEELARQPVPVVDVHSGRPIMLFAGPEIDRPKDAPADSGLKGGLGGGGPLFGAPGIPILRSRRVKGAARRSKAQTRKGPKASPKANPSRPPASRRTPGAKATPKGATRATPRPASKAMAARPEGFEPPFSTIDALRAGLRPAAAPA